MHAHSTTHSWSHFIEVTTSLLMECITHTLNILWSQLLTLCLLQVFREIIIMIHQRSMFRILYMCNELSHTCVSGVKQLVCLCVSVLVIDFWSRYSESNNLQSFLCTHNAKLPEFLFLCVLLSYTHYITTQWMYIHTLYQT